MKRIERQIYIYIASGKRAGIIAYRSSVSFAIIRLGAHVKGAFSFFDDTRKF